MSRSSSSSSSSVVVVLASLGDAGETGPRGMLAPLRREPDAALVPGREGGDGTARRAPETLRPLPAARAAVLPRDPVANGPWAIEGCSTGGDATAKGGATATAREKA